MLSPDFAFDLALKKAGIEHCNLVEVSSILPKGIEEINLELYENKNDFIHSTIKPGEITYVVLARMDGEKGQTIGAGVAWVREKKFGIVAEEHGYSDRKEIEERLDWKLREMAKIRGLKISGYKKRIEYMRVDDQYGCVLAALVYVPE